jgi:hypothetical protein
VSGETKWRLVAGTVGKDILPRLIAAREKFLEQLRNCTAKEKEHIDGQLRVIDAAIERYKD